MITVPVFFNQAESHYVAIMYAAELAGLKVLQLMNSNTAGEFQPWKKKNEKLPNWS